jgi:hypothetical protein
MGASQMVIFNGLRLLADAPGTQEFTGRRLA